MDRLDRVHSKDVQVEYIQANSGPSTYRRRQLETDSDDAVEFVEPAQLHRVWTRRPRQTVANRRTGALNGQLPSSHPRTPRRRATYNARATFRSTAEPVEPEPIVPIPTALAINSFQIREPEKVKLYLAEKFWQMTQQNLKKIAKVWIKAICPRKQAISPYTKKRKRNGKEEEEIQEPAPWWPPTNLCIFKEPDHILATGKCRPPTDFRLSMLICSRASESPCPPASLTTFAQRLDGLER